MNNTPEDPIPAPISHALYAAHETARGSAENADFAPADLLWRQYVELYNSHIKLEQELARWPIVLSDVTANMVPGLDGAGEDAPITPESVKEHLKSTQDEWDTAEKRIGEMDRGDRLWKFVLSEGKWLAKAKDPDVRLSLTSELVRELAMDKLPFEFDPYEARIDWGAAGKVHDWRNHVSDHFRAMWSVLPPPLRVAIAFDAERDSNDEHWD